MTRPAPAPGAATRLRPKRPDQADRYQSPWSLQERLMMLAWIIVHAILFRPTPKPLYRWRNLLLRLFGAKITGTPFVASSCIIKVPWQLTLEDHCALAHKCEVYNLGHVTLKARCVVSQYTYLCGGTHDLADPALPLLVGDIVIGEEAFIGAKAIVLPGVRVGEGAVLGAGAVAAKDLEPWTIYVGNPCKAVRKRESSRPL
jgi:putative colanic acid biosynthesis acetyltransferase WcaF